MIRAAESKLNSGDHVTAKKIADICNKKLKEYTDQNKSTPLIIRPASPHSHLKNLIAHNISLAFVTGHELGHVLQDEDTPVMQWAKKLYQENETEASKHGLGPKVIRFLKAECIQKFDAEGRPNGDALLQIKFAKEFDRQKLHFIQEIHADSIGLISATNAAIESGVPPYELFMFLFLGLEASEMLMSLKRTLTRLPTRGAPASVAHEHSSLGFRRFSLISAIHGLRTGRLAAPKEIRTYWKTMSRETIASLLASRNLGYAESVSNRVIHISRAALVYALTGSLPDAPSESQIRKLWGPMAGDGFFLNSFTKIPRAWMEIDLHHSWEPNNQDEVLAVGFASALKDIASVVFNSDEKERDSKISKIATAQAEHTLLSYVRHPRVQVFNRRLLPPPVLIRTSNS